MTDRSMVIASEPIITLQFSVREPVSKNATFIPITEKNPDPDDKRKMMRRSPEASAFRQRVALTAMQAARQAGWPTDIFIPARVRVTVVLYNGKWDAGACDTLIIDAMSRLLYHDDRIVCHGPADHPIWDDGGRRAVVTVELLSVRTQAEATEARLKYEKSKVKRLVRKARKMRKAAV